MKKTIQPPKREEAEYFSDFSGKKLGEHFPPVQVHFEFNYGSSFDGGKITFDLEDKEAVQILTFIRSRLSQKTRRELKRKLKQTNKQYNENFQFRDWQSLEYDEADSALLQLLLASDNK